MTGVAQGVVDKIVRIHHDVFMSGTAAIPSGKRDDMTLLVRNFNYPMPNALNSPTNPHVRYEKFDQKGGWEEEGKGRGGRKGKKSKRKIIIILKRKLTERLKKKKKILTTWKNTTN